MVSIALIEQFYSTLSRWQEQLNKYSGTQLLAKPAENSWSAGQVYMHIISNTEYFLQQVKVCASNNDNAGEDADAVAKQMFADNAFPDAKLEGPPENAFTPQPCGKNEIEQYFSVLKNNAGEAIRAMLNSACNGKTKHPGLLYFNAAEWLQFAQMHIRHHERQLKRIDQFLNEQGIQ
jgi:hypothetical protein